jgi:hypothetical protein
MNMNWMTKGMRTLAITALVAVAAGCASTGINHVGPEEFIREAKTMEYCNSASGTFYLGASPTRVYVERTGLYRLIRFHDAMVYWTELDGLPKEIADVIRGGKCPWTPWEKNMKEANQAPVDTARKLADPQR